MNIVKDVVDEAKRKLADEKRRHPDRFSDRSYAQRRLESYVKSAKERDIKVSAKGYSNIIDKEFWKHLSNRALEIFVDLFVGLIVFYFPVSLALSWFDVSSIYVATLLSAFIGIIVWDVVFFDRTTENFKAGITYGEFHKSKKYHDALTEIKKGGDTV
jgi:hypothetical protein